MSSGRIERCWRCAHECGNPTDDRGRLAVGARDLPEGLATGLASFETDVPESEGAGLWTLQAGIFPENVASVTLHEKCGFRVVGRRERLGQLHGVWRDVLLLERRSTVIGA